MQNTFKRISIIVAALLPVAALGWVALQTDSNSASVDAVVVTAAPVTEAASKTTTKPVTTTATKTQTTTPTTTTTTTTSPTSAPVSTTPATTTATTTSPTPTPAPASVYKDGTYSVTTSYRVPEASAQTMGVTLTIVNDIVTAVSLNKTATDGTSLAYQNAFEGGYKTFVVGKNIASISLSRVSGASLTSRSFNDALSAIKTKAAV